MQISKETDLKQLKDLGFNMYGDVNIAKRKLYESISKGDKSNNDMIMFDKATSKNYYELSTLLKKNDYMQRCTNTNAKASVIALLLLREFQSKKSTLIEEVVNCFTERKVYPAVQRVVIFSDIIEILSIYSKEYLSEDFYQNLLDYLANMIFEFGI